MSVLDGGELNKSVREGAPNCSQVSRFLEYVSFRRMGLTEGIIFLRISSNLWAGYVVQPYTRWQSAVSSLLLHPRILRLEFQVLDPAKMARLPMMGPQPYGQFWRPGTAAGSCRPGFLGTSTDSPGAFSIVDFPSAQMMVISTTCCSVQPNAELFRTKSDWAQRPQTRQPVGARDSPASPEPIF